MDSAEFSHFGKAMIDYVSGYLDNIRDRPLLANVEPGYLRDLIPPSAPEQGEHWTEVMKDLERVIMPGMSHFQSPNFHGFFAQGNSYPAIVADILSASLGCIGFSWEVNPAYTELEVVTMDWLGKAIGLPPKFLNGESGGSGGGVIEGSASECTLVSLVSAREKFLRKYKERNPDRDVDAIKGKLVMYTSAQAHFSVEKSANLGGVKTTLVDIDQNFKMRGDALRAAIKKDKEAGLLPFMVVATFGTTDSCAFDDVDELGDVCAEEDGLWLHVDAAYAGAAFLCEEYRYLMKGIDKVDSFCFNPHKWMLVNFDCSAMWTSKVKDVLQALQVDSSILKSNVEGVVNYWNWQIAQGRRFRSLKLWFVLRIYGLEKIRQHIRTQIRLAHQFEERLRKDDRFEIVVPALMGLVCFRLKDATNPENKGFLESVKARGKIFMNATELRGRHTIRFPICSRLTTEQDVDNAVEEIKESTTVWLSKK